MTLKPEKNTILEDMRRDWNTMRTLHGKERLEFIYDYFKWYILAGLFILFVIFTFARILYEGQRYCRLQVCVVLNAEADLSDPWFDRFTEELCSDGNPGYVDVNHDQPFDYDNQYYNVQELEVMTTVSSGRMDVAICNADMYSYLLAINACAALDEFLPEGLTQELTSRNMLVFDTAGLKILPDGSLDRTDAEDGLFAVDLTGTAFAEAYDGNEEQAPLYGVIIRNTESNADCIALLDAITE